MAAGDASRTWFPELKEILETAWRPAMSVGEVVALTTRLDETLQRIRKERGILPPMFRCPHCGQRERSAPTHVTVRAAILAMGRFGIASEEVVKELEKRWRKHRKEHDLDAYGRKTRTK